MPLGVDRPPHQWQNLVSASSAPSFRNTITGGFSEGCLEYCLQALLLLAVTGGCTWHFVDETGRTNVLQYTGQSHTTEELL